MSPTSSKSEKRYHFNAKTGRTGQCPAKIRCRLGIPLDEHFATDKEAKAAFEKQNESELKKGLAGQRKLSSDSSTAQTRIGSALEKEPVEPLTIISAHRETSLSKDARNLPKTAFDRNLEPAGRYVIDVSDTGGTHLDTSEWEVVEVSYQRPLHIESGDYGEDSSWKKRLSETYGNKTGRNLSKAVAKDYDVIVTSDKYGRGEIVDLASFTDD